MNEDEIDAVLSRCEQALAGGEEIELGRLGFWRAVGAIKRRPDLVERYADRVGRIDREAFEQAVWPTLPVPVGTILLGLGTLVGWQLTRIHQAFAVLIGSGFLLGTTHGLAHLVVGYVTGIRYSHWFLNGPTRVQPGLKVDYASYLRAPAMGRAWMHASGALVSKFIPVLILLSTRRQGLPAWSRAMLAAVGVLQIGTDLLISVRVSDWKRFRGEWRIARG